jgi:hypothetical protein
LLYPAPQRLNLTQPVVELVPTPLPRSQFSAISNLPSIAAAGAERNRTDHDDKEGDWRVSGLARLEQEGESKAAQASTSTGSPRPTLPASTTEA